MKNRPAFLTAPLPPEPSPAFLEAEHAQTLAYIEEVGWATAPSFDEGEILFGIDRLCEIEAAMPPDLRAKYRPALDPQEEVSF